jgi:hypothetical protein
MRSLLGNGSVKNPLTVARQRIGKNPHIDARQRLARNVTALTNTQETIEELLDASFSMWPVMYQGKKAISSSQNSLYVFQTQPWSASYLLHSCTMTKESAGVNKNERMEASRIEEHNSTVLG